ncbi:hypothetical protein ACIQVO_24965 [Streptomyces sp. NPDC101062]|uniref:hypothetical protein n=1 Tax=unclassified Streptomyces TaxID=2593676 RepID=UPI002E79241D|nr:hypothetical protein [Streptomyces sp. JV176]MEE1803892.1 hypothetical protein [Streptomyces sp. JV176]
MSFGHGQGGQGPSWGGPGSPDHDPYGARQSQGGYGSQDPYEPPASDRYDTQTPDWAALADASAARGRRKRWLMIGGGVLATGAVAAIVATAVVSMNGSGTDNGTENTAGQLPTSGTDVPNQNGEPAPSFPSAAPLPPPDPKDFISSADKDKAPLGEDTLFPGKKLTMGDRVYLKAATTSTTNCAAATQGALGSVLASNSCDQVIRATYHKDGVAVTVGVAVFEREAQALKAKDQAQGGIASLSGSGVDTFCRAPSICLKTTNSYGRYVYFTVGGFMNGKNVAKTDKGVYATCDDLAEFTFRQILGRGQAQASAAATEPVTQ